MNSTTAWGLAAAGTAAFVVSKYFLFADCTFTLATCRDQPSRFDGKVVWITGASSGIGKSLALALAQRSSVKLVLSSRSRNALEELKRALVEKGKSESDIFVCPFDVTSEEEQQKALQDIEATFGVIDVLVNNAGVSLRSEVQGCTPEAEDKVFDCNFIAPIRLFRRVYSSMLERQSGMIVTVASVAGRVGLPSRSAYCASKHAILGYMDSVRLECMDKGVKIVNICPGPIRTNIAFNSLQGDGKGTVGKKDSVIERGMDPDKCALLICRAMENNIEEAWIGPFYVTSLVKYMKQFFPPVFDFLFRRQVRTISQPQYQT
mmetsp:Transcript_19425/g.49795  ORF Transcript_19425/g.49795 Transcript_19425/m.49795 type:complete len:319 (-) Transcript_19425:312-1268(-)